MLDVPDSNAKHGFRLKRAEDQHTRCPQQDDCAFPQSKLRRHKLWATSCLAAVSAGWLASHFIAADNPLTGYIRAACEAGMVGGVADWFAVTALFKSPLGLPIPHTSLISRNQPRIADGVAAYIDSEFLERETLVSQMRGMDVAARLSGLLDQSEIRERLVSGIMNFIPRIVLGNDRRIAETVSFSLRQSLSGADLRPLVGQILEGIVQSDDLIRIVCSLTEVAESKLDENRALVLKEVKENTSWWIPSFVDAEIADKFVIGLSNKLRLARDPSTTEGLRLRAWLKTIPSQVLISDGFTTKLFEAVNNFIAGQDVDRVVRSVTADLRRALEGDLRSQDSNVRAALLKFLEALSSEVLDSVKLRNEINKTVEALIVEQIPAWRTEIRSFIRRTLTKQDPRAFARKIELQVGKDLQFIRISGTALGCLVGIGIYFANSLF